jgi:hypothetical protein
MSSEDLGEVEKKPALMFSEDLGKGDRIAAFHNN